MYYRYSKRTTSGSAANMLRITIQKTLTLKTAKRREIMSHRKVCDQKSVVTRITPGRVSNIEAIEQITYTSVRNSLNSQRYTCTQCRQRQKMLS